MYTQEPPGSDEGEIKSVKISRDVAKDWYITAQVVRNARAATRLRDWLEDRIGDSFP